MAAPMVKTRHPGIYKRGSRYVVRYRTPEGVHKAESARTLDQARALLAGKRTEIARGEYQEQATVSFHAYAREWIERYQGNGRRGFRENTRDEYRRLLENHAIRFFSPKRRVSDITPMDIAQFIAWLCDPEKQDGRELSDQTVRNALNPVRACLATAVREGLIRHNPTQNAAMPNRPRVEDDDDEDEDTRALSTVQLAAFLQIVHPRYRLMFRTLAATGLRISELIALQWKHLSLETAPELRVRRAIVRGRVGPPKTRHGRRSVPLSPAVARDLRNWRTQTEWPGDNDLVFPSTVGTPIMPGNLRRRIVAPVMQEIGASWAGCHAFRHAYASLQIAAGADVLELSKALGHHSPSFTYNTYAWLLDGRRIAPLDLDAVVSASENPVRTSPTDSDPAPPDSALADLAV